MIACVQQSSPCDKAAKTKNMRMLWFVALDSNVIPACYGQAICIADLAPLDRKTFVLTKPNSKMEHCASFSGLC